MAQLHGAADDPSPRRISLGSGERVDYPTPTSAAATAIGKANRKVDTQPELRLRSVLHRRGRRFRKDFAVRLETLRVKVDIAFPAKRLAVFVDGCFWHGCDLHGSTPSANQTYWSAKLRSNHERDARVTAALRASGWEVVRVWEHMPVDEAADAVDAALAAIALKPKQRQ